MGSDDEGDYVSKNHAAAFFKSLEGNNFLALFNPRLAPFKYMMKYDNQGELG